MSELEMHWRPGDEPAAPLNVAVSGAAGRVAYGLVFRIAAGELFGPHQPVALRLLDVDGAIELLTAIQLELLDCAFPLLTSLQLTTHADEAFADADWIIMLASSGRLAWDAPRLDLVRANAPLYVEHGQVINRVAARARMLVVAEPCNTNCLIALHQAPNVPREHWFALNRLARMRATALIAEKAGVAVSQVNRVTVWGNLSEHIFVDFHNTFIGDRPAHQVILDRDWPRKVLEPAVARRESEVFRLRGSTPAATAVQAILGTIRSITNPTPFGRRFGAAVCTNGSYGVPYGLVFGLPLRTEDGRSWSVVDGLYLDDYANSRLQQNIDELEHEAVVAGR
jgi:malate dehydrogenase